VQRTESDAGITHEELEHLVPSLPVAATTNPVQCPVCGCVLPKRTQRDRDADQPEVKRAALEAVDLCAQCIRTPCDGLEVSVIAEVLVCLVQREDHTGQTVVEGRVPGSTPVPSISQSAAPRARRAACAPRDN